MHNQQEGMCLGSISPLPCDFPKLIISFIYPLHNSPHNGPLFPSLSQSLSPKFSLIMATLCILNISTIQLCVETLSCLKDMNKKSCNQTKNLFISKNKKVFHLWKRKDSQSLRTSQEEATFFQDHKTQNTIRPKGKSDHRSKAQIDLVFSEPALLNRNMSYQIYNCFHI